MDVDQTDGSIYIVFYDRRKSISTRTHVYLASSSDGGQNWKNERISRKSFKPNPNVFFGDYNQIDVYNGVVRPIWTRYDKRGELSIWTALINKSKESN